jgi:hypothetical protein
MDRETALKIKGKHPVKIGRDPASPFQPQCIFSIAWNRGQPSTSTLIPSRPLSAMVPHGVQRQRRLTGSTPASMAGAASMKNALGSKLNRIAFVCSIFRSSFPSFSSPVHHVLTIAHDHGRLVHAILGVRASPLFLAGGRITRVAWTRRRLSRETVKKP